MMGADTGDMRAKLTLSILMVALVGCGVAEGASTDRFHSANAAAARLEVSAPAFAAVSRTIDPIPVATRAVWEGFDETRETAGSLAAYAHGPLDVYERPGTGKPVTTLDPTTIMGTVTVLGVVGEPGAEWVEVMLPIRPNGSTGWVRIDEVSLFVADGKIVVDLTERKLTYLVDDFVVLDSVVGIGSRYNETPTGEYFVTDRVALMDPASPWGPHALGLSARSDTVTEYNGGDGIIGIHGTNNPSSIGANISLGCVRLPNELITELYELVPLGTRVEIRA